MAAEKKKLAWAISSLVLLVGFAVFVVSSPWPARLNSRVVILNLIGIPVLAIISALLFKLQRKIRETPPIQSPKDGQEIFVWPKSMMVYAYIFLAFAILECSLFFVPHFDPRQKNLIWPLFGVGCVGLAFFGGFFIYLFRMRSFRIIVDEKGITEEKFGIQKTFPWSEVKEIKTGPKYLSMKRLKIINRDGSTMKIDYRLGSFSKLLEIILAHQPPMEENLLLPLKYGKIRNRQKEILFGLILIAIILVLGFEYLPQKNHLLVILASAAIGANLFKNKTMKKIVTYTEVNWNDLVIVNFNGVTKIDVGNLEKVTAETIMGSNGNEMLQTVIRTKDGNRFEIPGSVVNPIALVSILRKVMEKANY